MYNISKLIKWDYYRGYLQLLEQLTITLSKDISYEKFCEQYDKLTSNIYVIRDKNKIIATGTIFIENKFIHNLGCVGHIEDIVVDRAYRKKGIGKEIINALVNYAKKCGCYKVILNCAEKNIGFYKKCDFVKKEVEMVYKIK